MPKAGAAVPEFNLRNSQMTRARFEHGNGETERHQAGSAGETWWRCATPHSPIASGICGFPNVKSSINKVTWLSKNAPSGGRSFPAVRLFPYPSHTRNKLPVMLRPKPKYSLLASERSWGSDVHHVARHCRTEPCGRTRFRTAFKTKATFYII